MKLATALSERSDIQRRLEDIEVRLVNNAKTQEGDSPAEDPVELLAELDRLTAGYEELMARINRTNSATVIDGRTVTELIARRDALKKYFDIMKGFMNAASQKIDRYSRAEIRVESTVDVKTLQKKTDSVSKELRELDEKLQEANWTTELL